MNGMQKLCLICFVCLMACGAAQRRVVIETGAEACERIAIAYCRPDIALMCRTAADLTPIIEQLLGENQGSEGQCR
jgi:hypothetical protein